MKSRHRRLRSRSSTQARQQARSRIFHSPGPGAESAELSERPEAEPAASERAA